MKSLEYSQKMYSQNPLNKKMSKKRYQQNPGLQKQNSLKRYYQNRDAILHATKDKFLRYKFSDNVMDKLKMALKKENKRWLNKDYYDQSVLKNRSHKVGILIHASNSIRKLKLNSFSDFGEQ
uniref:Uncharacterized protein n=1 Tax=Amphimedon queenslandica TaxID=400682 RepID=A0A1X7UZP0_AMPQE